MTIPPFANSPLHQYGLHVRPLIVARKSRQAASHTFYNVIHHCNCGAELFRWCWRCTRRPPQPDGKRSKRFGAHGDHQWYLHPTSRFANGLKQTQLILCFACSAKVHQTKRAVSDILRRKMLSACCQCSAQSMNIEAHVENLQCKHGDLEREIQEALAHPSVNETKLHDLKRRKLHLKDEIERLKSAGTSATS